MRPDRLFVALGLLPLLAGAAWLIALREPTPVAAAADRGGPREPALAEPYAAQDSAGWLGVIVAGQEADIAAELGIGHGTFYRYFRNKHDIAAHVLDRVVERVAAGALEEDPEASDTLEEYRE